MTHLSKRPAALLTILQLLTLSIALFGTWFAAILALLGGSALSELFRGAQWAAEGSLPVILFFAGAMAAVVTVSVCCYIALGSFLALLQRMKKETAFTQRNCRALGRMALCCAVAAAVIFVMMCYAAVGVFLTTRSFTRNLWTYIEAVQMLMIWPFGFGVVSLLIQGVRVLMTRAIALREEQELVV